MQANALMSQNLHKWMVLQNDAVVALRGPHRRRNGNAMDFYRQTCGKPYEKCLPRRPLYRSGKISARYL